MFARLGARVSPFHLVCGALTLVLLLQVLQMRFGRDQGIYAMVAAAILDGGMPYRDAWDFKPPGIYLVYALAQLMFGRNEWGIRVLETVSLASLWPAFWLLARRFNHDARVGSLAASLSVLIFAELEFWHTAQPESFGGVIAIWGVLAAAPLISEGVAPRRMLALSAVAGCLFGLSAVMKPNFGGGAVVLAGWLLLGAWRGRWGFKLATLGSAATLAAAVTSTRDLPQSFLQRSLQRTRALLGASAEEREGLAAQLYSVADVS